VPQTVEITFWTALGGANGQILQDIVDRYNASQKDVKVVVQFQGDYTATEQKFLAALAAGQVPDLVMLEISRIPGFAASGALQPLDDYAGGKDGIDLSDFVKALLDESRIGGKLYSLPQSRSMPVFYYNKDLFKAAGLDDSQAPATWEDLRAAAIKLTKPDGSIMGFGFQIGNPWWYFQAAVEQNGGQVSDPVTRQPTFNNEKGVEAIQWWYDLIYKDKAVKIYPGQGLTTWEALQADFISGKVAMMFITTGWMGNIEKNSKFRVGVGMLPAGKGGRAAPTGGNGLVIPAKAPEAKKAAAWKFLKWITDTPQTVEWAMKTGYMPLRLSALKDATMQKYFAERPNFKVAVEQMQYARSFPSIKLHPKTERTADVMWEKIFVGKEPIKATMDATAKEIAELVKELK
jgi:sn-glycerol 3-phosphate transport system substrate-binding protein